MGKLRDLKIALLTQLAPKLEPYGFHLRKSASMFFRKTTYGEDRFHITSIFHAYDFDVEAGVAVRFDDLEDIMNEQNPYLNAREKEKTSSIGAELGNIVSRRPHRWTIAPNADLEYMSSSIMSMFKNVGLPFFERFRTLEAVVAVLSRDDEEFALYSPFIIIRAKRALAGALCLEDKALFDSIFHAKDKMYEERVKRFSEEEEERQEFLRFADRLREKWKQGGRHDR